LAVHDRIKRKYRRLLLGLQSVEDVHAISYPHFLAVFHHVWVVATDLQQRIGLRAVPLDRTDWRANMLLLNRAISQAAASHDTALEQEIDDQLSEIEDSYLRCDAAFKAHTPVFTESPS
jgi:hypothetical protein